MNYTIITDDPFMASLIRLWEANEALRHQLVDVIDAPMDGGWLDQAASMPSGELLVSRDAFTRLYEALGAWLEATKETI